MDDQTILALVMTRAADAHRRNDIDPPPTFPPPVSAAELVKVERELGYALPPLLRRVYTEIGDGWFGPGCGLQGAICGHFHDDEDERVSVAPDRPHHGFSGFTGSPAAPAGNLGRSTTGGMMRRIVALLLRLVGVGCSRKGDPAATPAVAAPKSGLNASCSPNPCNQHTHPTVQQPPYRYMWYYRTEVCNTLDVPLRVVWFEAFHWEGGRWVPGNITGRTLTGQDFSEWYTHGDKIIDGVIPPGSTAVDNRNWHGSLRPTPEPMKWAYRAVAPSGTEHYAEVVIESVPIRE